MECELSIDPGQKVIAQEFGYFKSKTNLSELRTFYRSQENYQHDLSEVAPGR
jgi:hypothetical protein